MERHLRTNKKHFDKNDVQFGFGYKFLYLFAFCLIIFGLSQNNPYEIFLGLKKQILSPDALITDYIALSGIGASFVNAGLILMIFGLILFWQKMRLTGAHMAGLFIICGFSFFGKNLLNIWFPFAGVYLFAKYRREPFTHYIIPALFSTGLAPVVSEILFYPDINLYLAISLATFSGIALGFVVAPVASHIINSHQGLNLYNVGFSASLIGTLYISVLKSKGFEFEKRMLWSSGNNLLLASFLIVLFLLVILLGFILNGKSFSRYSNILSYPGRLVSDFLILEGKEISFINMGIMGLLSTIYILVIGGEINGPTIAGIFTIMGFSSFGKHPKNAFPIVLGVVIAATALEFKLNDPSLQLAALFGTALAPVAGEFGFFWGIFAGFFHAALSQYMGVLHSGIVLYNNGFSTGLVAAVLAPIIEIIRKDDY